MTYTQAAVLAVTSALVVDLWLLRTRLVRRRVFWASYGIVLVFQLITNGLLTGLGVVHYSGAAIIGSDSPESGAPALMGDGRIMFAPVEDLLYGFGLILVTCSYWIWLGRRGIQREPAAGPPRWRD